MFQLTDQVAPNKQNNVMDINVLRMALTVLGFHENTVKNFHSYADDSLFSSIKSFQAANKLNADGIIKTNGPTQAIIKQKLAEDNLAGTAFTDFKDSFDNMNQANTIGADKYFHCVANFNASRRGWAGKTVAHILSDAKEVKDVYIRGYNDSAEDQKANSWGRQAAELDDYQSAQQACAIYRPEGLDEKY
jgi:peptidoglycan hydrolase-like protein with peptidoglycan-binding domain